MSGASIYSLGTTDTIPREYHRKVLKKIAQLTKVIHVLNTKNDEHEVLVEKLSSTHKSEIDEILSDCTSKLNKYKEQLIVNNEGTEKRLVSLNEKFVKVQEERDQVKREQVSYEKTAEDRFAEIKLQYSEKLSDMKNQLKELRSSQTRQMKQVSQLQGDWSQQLADQSSEHDHKHKKEVENLQKQLCMQSKKELSSLEARHKQEMAGLRLELEGIGKAQQIKLGMSHKKVMEEEIKVSQELLKQQFAQEEENLKHQISVLSGDLRETKDRLALAEQKLSCSTSLLEDNQAVSITRLKLAEGEAKDLRTKMRHLENELDNSKRLYHQQSSKLDEVTKSVSYLQVLRVANEGTIQKLKDRILDLEKIILDLKDEKGELESYHINVSEQQSAKISLLEKELRRLQFEKEEMKLQYAREIEAAQAQLSNRESELCSEHLEKLEQLHNNHQKAMQDAQKAHALAVEQVEKHVRAEKEKELFDIDQECKQDINHIRASLSEQTRELNIAKEELDSLRAELAVKEKGFRSMASSLNQAKEDILSTRMDLAATKKEKQETIAENQRLMKTMETMKERIARDQNQLKETRRNLTTELDEKWKIKLRDECEALRDSLSLKHEEDTIVALKELANLKDHALKEAKIQWDETRKELSLKIFTLEKHIKKLQESSFSSLEEARCAAGKLIETLREESKEQQAQHVALIRQLKTSHAQELERLRKQQVLDRETAIKNVLDQHMTEQKKQHTANQLAMLALQEQIAEKNWNTMEEMKKAHAAEVGALKGQFFMEKDEALSALVMEHRKVLEGHQMDKERMITEREKEKANYIRTVVELNAKVEQQNAELSKLRVKTNTLTVNVNNLRKEVEAKGHEILMVRRETNTLLQQRGRDLTAAHQAEMESVNLQHEHQCQQLVMDFNSAKSLIMDRLQQREKEIVEWEQRYKCRESRLEDLEKISELKSLTDQQKKRIKDLVAEKRVYQLELVNREKNYNQIFSASPQIGVLNPLAHKEKKKSSDAFMGNRYPSAPSLFPQHPHPEAHIPVPPAPSLSSIQYPLEPLGKGSSCSTSSLSSSHSSQPEVRTKLRRAVSLKDSPLAKHKVSASGKDIKRTTIKSPVKSPSPPSQLQFEPLEAIAVTGE